MPAWGTYLAASWRRLRANRRGTVAIEFGFALPVLILLTVGLIDVSRLLWSSSTIENAAAEGARYAIVNGSDSLSPATAGDIENFVRAQAVGVPATALNVDVSWYPNNHPGSRVVVALAYTHDFLIGALIGLDPVTINKTSRMTIF